VTGVQTCALPICLLEPQIGETLSREFRKLGFRFVTLDLGGFRSGSLNEGVVANQPPAS
jgi:PP-loop superfamily ATP-utilizing enzyme